MKISKTQLKLLIKEFLLEMLHGDVSSAPASSQSNIVENKHQQRQRQQQPVKEDDIMTSIFKDTAGTTLVAQMQGDRRPSYVPTADISAEKNSIPPPGPDRWELLAFMDSKKGN